MSTNEYAFPVHETPDSTDSPGMTLRDYFAAKAMAAAIAHHGIYDEGHPSASMTTATAFGYFAEEVAKIAYAYADEMMAARKA